MHRADPPRGANVRTARATRSRSKLCRSPSRSLNEARDAFARLFDLLEARRVTGAHVPSSPLAEGAAGYRHDLLLEQEPLRELLVVHSRRRDVGEAIERAARLEAVEAEVVEALEHHFAAPVVLADHTQHLVFTGAQRLERRVLTRCRDAHHRVLVDLHHLLDDPG